MPCVIAWAEPGLVLFRGARTPCWGMMFELNRGGSGFTAQDRLHGFCGHETIEESDGSFRAIGDRSNPLLMAVHESEPEELEGFVPQILEGYQQRLTESGFSVL